MTVLPDYLAGSAAGHPDHCAIEDGHRRISYRDLHQLARQVCHELRALGVGPGDRVGVFSPKSIDGVAAFHGIMLAGAAYVPADPSAPAARAALIHSDCNVRAVVLDRSLSEAYRTAYQAHGDMPPALLVDREAGGLMADSRRSIARPSAKPAAGDRPASGDDLAYILYTSGSTGRPKGVMLTHENAVTFVDWCSEIFSPASSDRCSSHAPFHFDLSILDIYLALKHGATLVLVPDELGKDPVRLAPFIAEKKISIWYSAPSILSLLAQFGDLPNQDLTPLRLVLFAGEVFPVKYLRELKRQLPRPVYYNLYGPTETNVCTYYRIPDEIPDEQTQPFPIGQVCSHLQAKAIDGAGQAVRAGAEGELVVRGPAVTQGYWNLADRNAAAFHVDQDGTRWYRTGDVVIGQDGCYSFLGRRDRMVKKRGYRIELGEIESCSYQHPNVKEAGVISLTDGDGNVEIVLVLATRDGSKLSLIALKRFFAERLPMYMVPDRFIHLSTLPRTSTDKVDYQILKQLATSQAASRG